MRRATAGVIRRKTGKRGFTLGETMVALLIVVLLTAVVAAGIPTAQRAFVQVVDAGNAEVLLSTALIELQTRLSTATEVRLKTDDDSFLIAYKDGGTNLWFSVVDNAEIGLTVQQILMSPDGTVGTLTEPFTRPLVTNKAATEHLRATAEAIGYNSATETFSVEGLKVLDSSGKEYASMDGSYAIRSINRLAVVG